MLSRLEGIIPALETAHAIAWVSQNSSSFQPDDLIVVCLSGRGDKDVAEVAQRGVSPV
jgi:tryptophan synthase beta chain